MMGMGETAINWILSGVAVLLCLTVHECSHGLISYWLGDPTAKKMGRLSLNPLHHLDPVGAFCLLFFKFGWAKPVPINPNHYKNFRLGTVLTSIAGPLSNFLFAFITLLLYAIWDVFVPIPILTYVSFFVSTLVSMNLGLAVFNLIPIPPLDGSKILFALLPERAYRVVLQYERYGFFVLLFLIYANNSFGGLLNRGISNLYDLLIYLVTMLLTLLERLF